MTKHNTEYTNIIYKVIVIVRDGKNVEKWVKVMSNNDVIC